MTNSTKKQGFISRHPRMSYLVVGFLMGLTMMGGFWYGNRGAVDVYKSQISRLETELVQEEYKYEKLRIAHKELKTSFNESFEEIIKPDGTKIVKRVTENDTSSLSSEAEGSRINQTSTKNKTAAETAVTSSETKDLSLNLHFSTQLRVGIDAYYRILPPFTLGIGVSSDIENPSLIKELRFGLGIRL